jgi:hypothetical protein
MLERLAGFRGNKGAIPQFAIKHAADMLVAAGVKFSESRERKTTVLPEEAILIPGIPPTEGLDSLGRIDLLDSVKRKLKSSDWAKDVTRRAETCEAGEATDLITLNSNAMGLPENPTTTQVWKKASEFGDKISAERFIRLAVEAAKGNVQVEIGKPLVAVMDQVAVSNGLPRVLFLRRDGDGLWLSSGSANPGRRWFPEVQFVVSSRK